MNASKHTHTHTHTQRKIFLITHAPTPTHTNMPARIHAHMHACTHPHAHMQSCTDTHTHTHMYPMWHTLQPLYKLLVMGSFLWRHLHALCGHVQHSLAIQLPARVRQTGQKLVQLGWEVILDAWCWSRKYSMGKLTCQPSQPRWQCITLLLWLINVSENGPVCWHC